MSEKLLNRREESSDRVQEYEKSEEFQGRQVLLKYGILKKINDLELYHGRAGDGSNGWSVDPAYDNAGNNTGHSNVNKISALNTGTIDVAREFSEARAHESYKNRVPEVHRIMSLDPEATIVDFSIYSSLEKEQKKEVDAALLKTMPKASLGAPIGFDDREVLNEISFDHFDYFDDSDDTRCIYLSDLKSIQAKTGYSESVVKNISSALNTMHLLLKGYGSSACNVLLVHNKNTARFKDSTESFPLNRDYLTNWFKLNHIIGYKTGVNSATLGKHIDNYLIYDLEKVNTPEAIQEDREKTYRRFGKLASDMYSEFYLSQNNLAKVLGKNLYIRPDQIIEMAKEVPRADGSTFRSFFEADAGNHEGYTIEEHTETVLRLFDDNYVDNMPADIIPFIRMTLLVHDIGKGEAVKDNQKDNQKAYNKKYAREFLEANRIDPDTINLIVSMITDGATLSTDAFVHGKEGADKKLWNYCKDRLTEYLGTNDVTDDDISGLQILCEILQTCDSAAYTDMAITRRGKRFFKNEADFNRSFESNYGFGSHTARLKHRIKS